MRERIPTLDGLRALACLSVMAFHAHIPGFGYGWLGVDLFFILSGFLTARQLGGGASPKRWLYRRWARLHPALLVLVATVTPLWLASGNDPAVPAAGAAFVYWPWISGDGGGMFGHLWSITVEVVAYVVAAVTLPWMLAHVRRGVLAVGYGAAAVAAVAFPLGAVGVMRPEGILLGICLGLAPAVSLPRLLPATRVLSAPVVTSVGLRTYSLYLWHLPVFSLAQHHTPLDGLPLVVVEFAVALVLAEASYRWVEVPSRQALNRAAPLVRRVLVLRPA